MNLEKDLKNLTLTEWLLSCKTKERIAKYLLEAIRDKDIAMTTATLSILFEKNDGIILITNVMFIAIAEGSLTDDEYFSSFREIFNTLDKSNHKILEILCDRVVSGEYDDKKPFSCSEAMSMNIANKIKPLIEGLKKEGYRSLTVGKGCFTASGYVFDDSVIIRFEDIAYGTNILKALEIIESICHAEVLPAFTGKRGYIYTFIDDTWVQSGECRQELLIRVC